MVKSQTLAKNIDTYNKCKTQLSEADLKGRYAKSFKRLKDDIRNESTNLFDEWLIQPFRLTEETTQEFIDETVKKYDAIRAKLIDAVYIKRDVEVFYDELITAQIELTSWYINHDEYVSLDAIRATAGEGENFYAEETRAAV